MTLDALPDPTSDDFAVSPLEREGHRVNTEPWTKAGAWKHRQFGDELQLRNAALPHLALDLYRAEAEDLYRALGNMLMLPAPTPFRASLWQRAHQWWLRKVWKRKHYREMAAATKEVIDFYTRKGPWG